MGGTQHHHIAVVVAQTQDPVGGQIPPQAPIVPRAVRSICRRDHHLGIMFGLGLVLLASRHIDPANPKIRFNDNINIWQVPLYMNNIFALKLPL